MTDTGYRLAVERVNKSQVARAAAAIARHFRRRPGHGAERTGAMMARLRATGQLSIGLGVRGFSRAGFRVVRPGDEPARTSGNGVGGIVPRTAPEIVRRATVAWVGLAKRKILAVGEHRELLGARAVGAACGAKTIDRVGPRFAGPRMQKVIVAQTSQRGWVPRLAAGATGAGARLAAPYGPRLAARTGTAGEMQENGAAMVTPGISAGLRHRVAGSNPQRGDAPGFHRTVRQTRSAAPAGDVYLDRNLVGYHLAAAITAEQTRAAARPGISGSSFNSSMAALRPSGTGI